MKKSDVKHKNIEKIDAPMSKRADPQADMSALVGEIDQLVYQLYGLSEDEIGIVEGKS